MKNDRTISSIIEEVSNASTTFENSNTEIKRQYLLWNIYSFIKIASVISVKEGIFGTGYPFYVLDENFQGQLPVITEQIRYNRQLKRDGKPVEKNIWYCKECLDENYYKMPDLKTICKRCPKTIDELKPRKIINRLPDIDMWLVCKDGCLNQATEELSKALEQVKMLPSDHNPLASIKDVCEISEMVRKGIPPKRFLPIDSHVIEASALKELIEAVPDELKRSAILEQTPYLPIRPISYRKVWQYDDDAYNFIYDYLSAFTPFEFSEELNKVLAESRQKVVSNYSSDELFDFILNTATPGNFKRFQTPEIESIFYKKIKSWRDKVQRKSDETVKLLSEIKGLDFGE